jgi:hypothetical protein
VLTSMPGNVRFHICEFSGNSAEEGAAVYTSDTSNPVFDTCDFYAGEAVRGGAVCCEGLSKPSVSVCYFVYAYMCMWFGASCTPTYTYTYTYTTHQIASMTVFLKMAHKTRT